MGLVNRPAGEKTHLGDGFTGQAGTIMIEYPSMAGGFAGISNIEYEQVVFAPEPGTWPLCITGVLLFLSKRLFFRRAR